MTADCHINFFFNQEDGCYVAGLPDFEHCSALGSTPEEALAELTVAREAWLAAARAKGDPIPVPHYRPFNYLAR